jgi:cytochrome c oxidase cbb3-type subunit 3
MSDFTSGFWSVYVAFITLAGIAGCAWLLMVNARARKAAKDAGGTATTGHMWDGDLTEYNNPLPAWWRNLFWITIVFALGYLVLFPGLGSMKGVLGWTSTGAYEKERTDADARTAPLFARFAATPVEKLAGDAEARALGERLFLTYCSQCHGSAALGAKGIPNLTDRDWLYGGDPATIEATIGGGRLGVMPALGATLGTDNTRNVAAYVRSLSGLPHDSLRAQLGKPVFAQSCAACHGPDGKGNTAVGAPNLTDDVWLYGSTEAAILEGIDNGRHMNVSPGTLAMPSFKDTLGEQKIHLLAAYVWGLSNRPAPP